MRLATFSTLLLPSVLASELASTSSTRDSASHPAVVQTPSPQPRTPYLELRQFELDRRQVQPAAAGAPAQAAAGAAQQPAGGAAAPAAAPKVQAPANAVAPAAQTPANPAAPAVAPVAAPAAPAAGGVVGAHGEVPVKSGPATALTQAPPVKSGSIGLGTLTGKIGVVKTDEAKSEAGLGTDNKFGLVASWPAAFKIGASLLLGTAVGVGLLL